MDAGCDTWSAFQIAADARLPNIRLTVSIAREVPQRQMTNLD